MSMDTLYILAGLAMMIVSIMLVLKISAWVWIKSKMAPAASAKKSKRAKAAPETEEAVSPQRVKAWLGVVAGILGLISTSAGLIRSCSTTPDKPPVIQYGGRCGTDYGICPMQHVAPVGKPCTCFDQFGNFASGTVVQ